MQVLVVGGTGGMGQGVARDLIKQEQIKKVVLGDINIDPGRVQDKLRASEKVSLRRIDVNDHKGLVDAIHGADVVINTAGPFYKTAVAVARQPSKRRSIISIFAMTIRRLTFFSPPILITQPRKWE